MGAAIALAVSGLSSAYIIETAERRHELRALEGAMIADLEDSVYGQARHLIPAVIALVNRLASLVISLLIILPFWLSALVPTFPFCLWNIDRGGNGSDLTARCLPREDQRNVLAVGGGSDAVDRSHHLRNHLPVYEIRIRRTSNSVKPRDFDPLSVSTPESVDSSDDLDSRTEKCTEAASCRVA